MSRLREDWADVVLREHLGGGKTSNVRSYYEWEHCTECGSPGWLCTDHVHEWTAHEGTVEGEIERWRGGYELQLTLHFGAWADDAEDLLPPKEWDLLADRIACDEDGDAGWEP